MTEVICASRGLIASSQTPALLLYAVRLDWAAEMLSIGKRRLEQFGQQALGWRWNVWEFKTRSLGFQ